MQSGSEHHLRFGLAFEDLYRREGLLRLDAAFLDHVAGADPSLCERLEAARRDPTGLAAKPEAELIVELAPHLEDFVAELFGIEAEVSLLRARHSELAPLHTAKRKFVMRRLVGKTPEHAKTIDGNAVTTELEAYLMGPLTELSYASHVVRWMESEAEHAEGLRLATDYAIWAVLTAEGQSRHRQGVVFRLPKKLNVYELVPHATSVIGGLPQFKGHEDHGRHREGFHLTDPGTDLAGALDQANYCIKCHHQGKDSCSHGLREKDGIVQEKPLRRPARRLPARGEDLRDERAEGRRAHRIGALAVAIIDNPMCAATGHRICNDCMKSCIYQKQEPVDIPQVETRTLKDVLELPWGFEIYSLLTRWNPLNFARPLPCRGDRAEGAGGRAGTGRVHAGASPDERRAFRGRGRRAEDRAVAGGDCPGSTRFGNRHRFEPIKDIDGHLRATGQAGDGRFRRRGGVRDHGSLGQEFPQGDPSAAGATRGSSRCTAASGSAGR